jgi:hypothetical protein
MVNKHYCLFSLSLIYNDNQSVLIELLPSHGQYPVGPKALKNLPPAMVTLVQTVDGLTIGEHGIIIT